MNQSDKKSAILLSAAIKGTGAILVGLLIAWATGNLNWGNRSTTEMQQPPNININVDNSSKPNIEINDHPPAEKKPEKEADGEWSRYIGNSLNAKKSPKTDKLQRASATAIPLAKVVPKEPAVTIPLPSSQTPDSSRSSNEAGSIRKKSETENLIEKTSGDNKLPLDENLVRGESNGEIQERFTWGNPPKNTTEIQLDNDAHRIVRSGLSISGDFFLDFTASTPKQFGAFEIVLKGAGHGQDLKLVFHCDGMFSDGYKYRASTPAGEVKFQPTRGGSRSFRLERSGKVFVLTCDSCRVSGKHEGNVTVGKFVSAQHKSFSGISMGVDKTSSISGVRFGQISSGE